MSGAEGMNLTDDQARYLGERVAMLAGRPAAEIADTFDPAVVKDGYARLVPYVELIDQLDRRTIRGTAANARVLRELAEETVSDALDAVAHERDRLAKLRAGDMRWCGMGLDPEESERQILAYVEEKEAAAVTAHAVLDLLEGVSA